MKLFVRLERLLTYAIARDDNSVSNKTRTSNSAGLARKKGFQLKYISPMVCFSYALFFTLCFLLFEAVKFVEFSETFYPFATVLINASTFVEMRLGGTTLFRLIDDLEKTIETRMANPVSKKIYDETNETIERWSMYFEHGMLHATGTILTAPFVLVSFFFYFVLDKGADSFFLPFLAWLPWGMDWLPGYIFSFILEAGTTYFTALEGVCMLCLPFGFCLIMVGFSKDIKAELDEWDKNQDKDSNDYEFYQRICRLVEFHAISLQYPERFHELFRRIYTYYFVWTAATICDSLLLLQVELSRGIENPVSFVKMLFLAFWSFFQICMFCDTSENIATHYMKIDVYRCKWYAYPARVQRVLPMIIRSIQEPVVLKAFGGIQCARSSSVTVVKGGASYFMILRQFLIP